jgi:hypothetical protein
MLPRFIHRDAVGTDAFYNFDENDWLDLSPVASNHLEPNDPSPEIAGSAEEVVLGAVSPPRSSWRRGF